jgi:arylsulfatase
MEFLDSPGYRYAMQPNVLLVVLDSVRARNTSLHGHAHETTPFLERLAATGTVYEQARAPGTDSVSSHASIFTGLEVPEHGLQSHGARIRPGHTVWEDLAADGYDTGLFTANPIVADVEGGLRRAFETVEGPREFPFAKGGTPDEFEGTGYVGYLRHCLDNDHPLQSLANGLAYKLRTAAPSRVPDALTPRTHGGYYADVALDWIDDRDAPWAACVNFIDPHYPYDPDPEYDRWAGDRLRAIHAEVGEDLVWEYPCERRPLWELRAFEALYDATIRQTDALVERLVTGLNDRDYLGDTLVVVTSDHGDGFGEPSLLRDGRWTIGHGVGIHEVLTHVPLVVRYPDGTAGPDRVTEPATLRRFPAVVESVVGDGEPAGFVPDGLVRCVSTGVDDPESVVPPDCPDLNQFRGPFRAIYESADIGVRKFATWQSSAATVAAPDAGTCYRLERGGRERVDAAFEGLEDAGVRADDDVALDEATEQRLSDLGYV